jgi:DNA polymerase (family 10)
MHIPAKIQMLLDALAWLCAFLLVTLFSHVPGLADIVIWTVLLLVGLAVAAQLGLNLPLYSGYRDYHSLEGMGVVVCTATAVVILLLVLNWLIPSLPASLLLTVGLTALTLMLILRWLQRHRRLLTNRDQVVEVRWPIGLALPLAQEIVASLAGNEAVLKCAYAGSVRRMCEQVGDIEIVVASDHPEQVVAAVLALPSIDRPLNVRRSVGRITKWLALSVQGIRIDVRLVPPHQFEHSLLYFTGAKAHTNQIRIEGFWRGYWSFPHRPRRPDSYWFFWLYWLTTRPLKQSGPLKTEEDIYRRLGMQWVPPPLREGRGEVKAARDGRLPRLVALSDIQGDLQICPQSPDRETTLRRMSLAAAAQGYRYCAIVNSMASARALSRQLKELEALNAELDGELRILHGAKFAIGPEGELDCSEAELEGLDLVVASLDHSADRDPNRVTKRLLTAITHPRLNIIATPTGRIVGRREAVRFDFAAICTAAARQQVALEIDARPDHLDLPDIYIREARQYGVRLAIGTHARSPQDLAQMHFGVAMAQRGWTTAEDIINAWPLKQLEDFLLKKCRLTPHH